LGSHSGPAERCTLGLTVPWEVLLALHFTSRNDHRTVRSQVAPSDGGGIRTAGKSTASKQQNHDRRVCANRLLSRRTVLGAAGSRRTRASAAHSRRASPLWHGLYAGALPWLCGREPLHGKMVHVRTEWVALVLETIAKQKRPVLALPRTRKMSDLLPQAAASRFAGKSARFTSASISR
jgi:hypothetical protein